MSISKKRLEQMKVFVDTGEAPEDFIKWLEKSPKARKILGKQMKADGIGDLLVEAAMQSREEKLAAPSTKAIIRQEQVVVITEDKELLDYKGELEGIIIPWKVYYYVEYFVKQNKAFIESLFFAEKPGTIKYWEYNYHDKFVMDIVKATGFAKKDVSNSLWTFGY
jgi:hypothetical protein